MNKKIIYLAGLALILGIGGYFLYSLLLPGGDIPATGTAKNFEFKFKTKIFSDQKFSDLKNNINLPVKAGEKGKTNPFMKF